MGADGFRSRCSSCGGEMAWIVTRSGKKMPVQILRKDATPTDQRDTFAQGVHVPHWAVCPYADRHRGGKVRKIVEKALPPVPPPAKDLDDAQLHAAADYYRAIKKPGDRQRQRLAELLHEIDRRTVAALPDRSVPDYGDQ